MFGKNKHLQKGVSLVELMIAMAIIGIMGALIVPNMTQRGPRYERKQFITRLSQLTQLAWQRAISYQRVHAVVFDLNQHKVWLEVETDTRDREGNMILKSIPTTGYGRTSFVWPDHIIFEQFFIEGYDELSRAGRGSTTEKIWFYVVPDGLAQQVIINAFDKKELRQRKSLEFSLVLNPFTARFQVYDAFKQPR